MGDYKDSSIGAVRSQAAAQMAAWKAAGKFVSQDMVEAYVTGYVRGISRLVDMITVDEVEAAILAGMGRPNGVVEGSNATG